MLIYLKCSLIGHLSHLHIFLEGKQRTTCSARAYIIGCNILNTYPAVPMLHNTNDVRNARCDAIRFTSQMNKGLYGCPSQVPKLRNVNVIVVDHCVGDKTGARTIERLQFGLRCMISRGHSYTSKSLHVGVSPSTHRFTSRR